LRGVESHFCFALDICRQAEASSLECTEALQRNAKSRLARCGEDEAEALQHARSASPCEAGMSHFQKGMLHSNYRMQTKAKEPSMLKFGLGVVLGIMIGIYLATSLPQLGQIFGWLALGTML
jgi:hypothetical protein